VTIFMKRGDTAPFFRAQCTDNGAAVNLTGTTAKLIIRKPSGAVINTSATVEGGTSGWVRRTWGSSDLDEVGDYKIEVEITWADATKQTFPPDDYERLVV
jgi:hypothetical protein